MKLLTRALREQLPAIKAAEHDPDPLVICKFFTPWTQWTWWPVEFDGEDEFFGLVDGLERELGYFRLRELEAMRGPGGLTVERDLYFEPCRLSEVH